MKVIGITGGTGVGKTTALSVLQEVYGAGVIDCDALYHTLLNSCRPMVLALLARFPGAFQSEQLDRKQLGRIVFADPAALQDLNAITHQFVKEAVEDRLQAFIAEEKQLAAIDAFALYESGIADLCHRVVFVRASEENRIRRIMDREGISMAYAESRVRA